MTSVLERPLIDVYRSLNLKHSEKFHNWPKSGWNVEITISDYCPPKYTSTACPLNISVSGSGTVVPSFFDLAVIKKLKMHNAKFFCQFTILPKL